MTRAPLSSGNCATRPFPWLFPFKRRQSQAQSNARLFLLTASRLNVARNHFGQAVQQLTLNNYGRYADCGNTRVSVLPRELADHLQQNDGGNACADSDRDWNFYSKRRTARSQ